MTPGPLPAPANHPPAGTRSPTPPAGRPTVRRRAPNRQSARTARLGPTAVPTAASCSWPPP